MATDSDSWILNCIVIDANAAIQGRPFPITISPNTTVGSLLGKIKQMYNASPVIFDLDLRLWRLIRDIPSFATMLEMQKVLAGLSFPDSDRGEPKNDDVEQLAMFPPVSQYWGVGVGPKPMCLHVILRSPVDA
ncbi:hypothetical protein C0992_012604, partial [Termitomyces sp. T32_za158]